MIDCVFLVIGYNNVTMTETCIASFRTADERLSVWLYDNASDPELRGIAEKFGIPYLRSRTNLGFSGGANRAIDWAMRHSTARVICVVNNDIVASDKFVEALEVELAHFGEESRTAAMTPLLFIDDACKTPENFGVFYYQSGLAFQNRTGRLDQRTLLNGAFLFLKTHICRQLVEQDGAVFRPDYFFNAEDVELSLRLLSRGYAIGVNPNLKVQHLGSQSGQHVSTLSFRLSWRNLLWTLLITRSRKELFRDAAAVFAGQLVLLALATGRRQPHLLGSVVADTWRHRQQLLSARRRFSALKQSQFREYVRPGVFPLIRLRIAP
jgi:GT2 family glycosyltransferase